MKSKDGPYFHFINKNANFTKKNPCLTTFIGYFSSIKVNFFMTRLKYISMGIISINIPLGNSTKSWFIILNN